MGRLERVTSMAIITRYSEFKKIIVKAKVNQHKDFIRRERFEFDDNGNFLSRLYRQIQHYVRYYEGKTNEQLIDLASFEYFPMSLHTLSKIVSQLDETSEINMEVIVREMMQYNNETLQYNVCWLYTLKRITESTGIAINMKSDTALVANTVAFMML